MVTKTGAAPPPPAEEQVVKVESEDEFLKRLRASASFDAELEWVKCPLKGYEHVEVGYNVDNDFEVGQLFEMAQGKALELPDIFRLWSLFIREVRWKFEVPPPTPSDLESYRPLLYQFKSLFYWCRDVGYEQAKEQRWGNSLGRSTKTSSSVEKPPS